MAVVLWIALAVAAGVIEAFTATLVSVWFAVGAVCAAIAAGFGLGTTAQCLIFLGISALLLLLTMPLCRKLRLNQKVPTNADRLIGRIGVITEAVDPILGKGEAKVCGQVWSVQLRGDGTAEVGEKIRVEGISGAHLVAQVVDVNNIDEREEEK